MFCSFTFQWVVVWGLIFTSKHFVLWRVNGDNVMEYKNGHVGICTREAMTNSLLQGSDPDELHQYLAVLQIQKLNNDYLTMEMTPRQGCCHY